MEGGERLEEALDTHQVFPGHQLQPLFCICRVAELGSLSSGTKMAEKIFVKHVFTIFATNASFLRVIANL